MNGQFVIPGQSVEFTSVTDSAEVVDITHEDIHQARQKEIAEFEQAAATIALSSSASPLYREASLEIANRPDVLKPPIEIEFILGNGEKIRAARQDYLAQRSRTIESLRGMAAMLGRRITRIDRIEHELINREAVVGGQTFVDALGYSFVPSGQTWRFSFQDSEWIWERFNNDDKEPFAVTRYVAISNRQNIQAIEYHINHPGVLTTEILDKNALRALGIWTYNTANAVRDKVYLRPESSGEHLQIDKI
ncbi:MAG: hypothetical protein WAV04_01635 [Candidatus Microsaccharimonas sp.]